MTKTIQQLAIESGFPVELMYDWENRLNKFGKAYMKQELEKLEAVGYILKTGHGASFKQIKPECEIDFWTPLYDLSSLKE